MSRFHDSLKFEGDGFAEWLYEHGMFSGRTPDGGVPAGTSVVKQGLDDTEWQYVDTPEKVCEV